VSQAQQIAPSSRPLRAWQRSALARYLASAPRDFLAVATPGAGKTAFALRVAAELLADRVINAVTVVTPTEHLKHQWSAAAAQVGIAIDPDFRNSTGGTSSDYTGIAVTYAGVAAHPLLHRARTENRRMLVILDEVHHAGDARSWGDAVKEAFDPATRRLTLTGTPFRSDDNPIPFVDYLPDAEGALRSRADHAYGYAEALADGVVRPVVFLAYSGVSSWRTSAGEEITARLGEPMTAEQTARAWRTALDPGGEWIPAVLSAADKRLAGHRAGGMPDAGGLVIASDQTTARAYAAILTDVTGTPPVVVLSDEQGASARIARFSESDDRWMVAVRMVSEGVDVPRLVVAAYATVRRTDLFFRQAVGRVLRRRAEDPGDLVATVFLPADPALTGCAERVEVELRQQVSDEIEAAFEVEPPPGVARPSDFQPLDAQVTPGGMIVAGVHYGREEVDAARRLLRELGQSERALRSVLEFVRRERVGAAPGVAPPVPAHRRVEAKRAALDRLARRWAQLRRAIDPQYTWPQAQARVNRAMGVARRSQAGEAQLDDGLAFLRAELRKLATHYPEQAERLRIPASVEAIDGRLLAATRDG
jgi:superfamily II DNA or RNA helicase